MEAIMEFFTFVIFVFLFGLWCLIIFCAGMGGKSKKRSRKRKLRNIDDYVNEFGEGIIEYREK